jgi:hypothetical protein
MVAQGQQALTVHDLQPAYFGDQFSPSRTILPRPRNNAILASGDAGLSGSDKDRLCEGDRDGPGCRGHAVSLRATSSIVLFRIGIVPNFVIDCNYRIFSSQLENVSAVSCSNSFDDPERVAP